MKFSESIANISAALCSFQAAVSNPKRSSLNPHFRSKYASLDDIIQTIRPMLQKFDLAFVQNPVKDEQGNIGCSTILLHKSGEYMEFDAVMIPLKQPTPHQVGSAMTYARRYSLSAALGISTEEDDDGPTFRPEPKAEKTTESTPKHQPKRDLGPWTKMATENVERLQLRRFFAICKKKSLSDKKMKAIVFYHTGKLSRKDLSEIELKEINRQLEESSPMEITQMIFEAVQMKQGVAASG